MRRAVVVRYEISSAYNADQLCDLVGRQSDFGGTGGGWVDHGWVCLDEAETIRVGRALSSVGLMPDVRDEGQY